MPKINCNIIKDLLPSYLDDISSPESRKLIEAHFAECENCKKLYEQAKLELSYADASTIKEVDYFKKIKHHVSAKNKVIYAIIAVLFLFMLYCNWNDYRFGGSFTMYINYLFPILTASLLFAVLPDYAEQPVPNKLKFTVLGVEFAIMTYIFALLLFIGNSLLHGIVPFVLETSDLGPFLHIQIVAVIILFSLAFVITLFLSTRKKRVCPALHVVPLGGIALMFEYDRWLHELTVDFTLSAIVRPFLLFACEAIILTAIYMFLNREKTFSI